MSKFLVTKGSQVLSIAICDRCRMKRRWVELIDDGNSPGLKVCGPSAPGENSGCYDHLDPWKLPARETENISLQFARPDAPLQGESDVDDPYVQY